MVHYWPWLHYHVINLKLQLSKFLQADRIPPKSLGADLSARRASQAHRLIAAKMNENTSDSKLNSWIQTIASGLKSRSGWFAPNCPGVFEFNFLKFETHWNNFTFQFSRNRKERDANYQKVWFPLWVRVMTPSFSKNGNVIIKLLLKIWPKQLFQSTTLKRCVIEAIERILSRFDLEKCWQVTH